MSEEQVIGVAPTEVNAEGQEVAAGPYIYGEATGTGYEAGVGLASGPIGTSGEVDVVAANAVFGDGESTHGGYGEAGVASVEIAPGGDLGPVGGSAEALTAEGGMYIGEDAAVGGATATLVGGSVAVGNEENNVEVGAGIGAGATGRVYYGDADNDGVREYGVGGDLGVVSVDVKSEAIGHGVNAVGGAANAVGNAAGGAKDAIGGAIGGLFGR